jgi:hypothetical protein
VNPKKKILAPTPEELKKLQRQKQRNSLDPEWVYIASFGMYYGFTGVEAILSNKITIEQANNLLRAAKKLEASKTIDNAVATQAAVASANSKKPKQVFERAMKKFIKQAKE